MNVLKIASIQLGCFVLGVDHLGKNVSLGARGGSPKEGSPDIVLVILAERETMVGS
jgi:hypothetical protein